MSNARRSPSILVTDARQGHKSAPFVRSQGKVTKSRSDRAPSPVRQQRSGNAGGNVGGNIGSNVGVNIEANLGGSNTPSLAPGNASSRFGQISIDNILSDVSDIPSAQRRLPLLPEARRKTTGGTTSRPQAPPRLGANLPSRTTKTSEKLVLIPEQDDVEGSFKFDDDEDDDYYEFEAHPPKPPTFIDNMGEEGKPRRTFAEKLPKDKRADKFPRVTSYCISDAVRLQAAAEYLRENHKILPRIYDEALFAPYYLPLLAGGKGSDSRVRSSPGGIQLLETLIDQSEQGDHHFEYYSGLESSRNSPDGTSSKRENDDPHDNSDEFDPSEPQSFSPPSSSSQYLHHEHGITDDCIPEVDEEHSSEISQEPSQGSDNTQQGEQAAHEPTHDHDENLKHAEMFIFTYGVVVFWNFTESQEKDILADLSFGRSMSVPTKPLVVRPIADQDIETEEFHFTYSPHTTRPRIYNDMITLKSGDHMIKLALSHAIAQSTKLSRFEARMNLNMHDVKHIPRTLALTGKLGMKREEVLKMSGKLFKLRVDVNLSSNVLDTPEFFWEAEPSLNPLYTALREYLEIEPRILVLNERCKVFLELADIIADSIAEFNMSRITWVIIILITLSVGVSLLEIAVRFTILRKR